MHANQKLTEAIAGKIVYRTVQENGVLVITFRDGATMKVETAPSSVNPTATGGKVLKVRQEGTDLSLDFTSGHSVLIATAKVTNSVMLHDGANKLKYAD